MGWARSAPILKRSERHLEACRPAREDVASPPPRRAKGSGHALMKDLLLTSFLAAIVGAFTGLIAVGVRIAIAFVTGLAFRGTVEWQFDSPVHFSWGIW